jgi:hypothetical protein
MDILFQHLCRLETFNLALALLYSGCHHFSSVRQMVFSSRMAEAPIVRTVDINKITSMIDAMNIE